MTGEKMSVPVQYRYNFFLPNILGSVDVEPTDAED